jgi:hypothetical protein
MRAIGESFTRDAEDGARLRERNQPWVALNFSASKLHRIADD